MIGKLFKKKRQRGIDSVTLSKRKVWFFDPTWNDVNEALKASTVLQDVINNAVFLDTFEHLIADISLEDYKNLSVEDGQLLRQKTLEIALRHKLVTVSKKSKVEPTPDYLTEADKEYFAREHARITAKVEGMRRAP